MIFTAAFSLEMCLKLVATGLYYFMDTWNWLDAVVVSEVNLGMLQLKLKTLQ